MFALASAAGVSETKKQIYVLNLNWFLILSSHCVLWQGDIMITK